MRKNFKKCIFIYSITIILISLLFTLFLLTKNRINSILSSKKNSIEYPNLIRNIEEDISYSDLSDNSTIFIIEEDDDEINDESFNSDVNKICSKASDDIQDYFKTYDESKMDLSKTYLKEIDIYPEYIEALIDVMEGDGKLKDNFFKYLSHAVAASFFLVLGIISIICWLCFGFFCCCNCCCCCCCKKPECKGKILFFSLLFDCIIIFTCLYGIISSNKMFTSFEDVECSFMKFISEISIGENRNDGTEWPGFTKILLTFNNIVNKVEEIKRENKTELDMIYNTKNEKKEKFKNASQETYQDLLDKKDPFSDILFDPEYCFHIIQENTINVLDVGALDILYNYGPYTNDEKFLYKLNDQYDTITEKAENYLNSAYKSLTNIFKENSIDIFVKEIKKNIKELRTSIDDIKKKFVKYIVKYGDIIDEKGNYMLMICYIAVIGLSCLSGISLVTMYSTTGECCYQKCCFGKGLTKTLSHISWNLMSIVMILSFFICGVIFLVSSIGKDLVDVFSVILGKQNIFSRKPIIIGNESSAYFNVCIHWDGDLPDILGIYSENFSLYEFDELNKIINNIEDAKLDLETTDLIIKEYRSTIEDRRNLTGVEIFDLNESFSMNLDDMISYYNELLSTVVYDMWTMGDTCKDTSYNLIHRPENIDDIVRKEIIDDETPKECLNFFEWKDGFEKRYGTPYVLAYDVTYNTVYKAAAYFVKAVNNITDYINNGTVINLIEEKIDIVEKAYNESIVAELEALDFFNKTIYNMLSVFNNIGDESKSLYSFLHCEFIRNNLLIVFKYLQKAFGGKVQAFGVTFVFASFSMFLSIFFTILEIVILNVSIYLQKRRREREEQLKLCLGGGQREKITTFETTGSENETIKKRKKKKAG